MYAVPFDLTVEDTEKHHPKGVSQAYSEIGAILGEHGFRRVQGSLYVTDDEDMANLFLAIKALRARAWFPKSVRDIRAFRVEQWSDFTAVVKSAGIRAQLWSDRSCAENSDEKVTAEPVLPELRAERLTHCRQGEHDHEKGSAVVDPLRSSPAHAGSV
jgi:virulence-associated protein VapD